jgi:hypothetical protein
MKVITVFFLLMTSCVSHQKYKRLEDRLIDAEIKSSKCIDLKQRIRSLKFSLQESKYKLKGCQRRLMLCDKMYSNARSLCYKK